MKRTSRIIHISISILILISGYIIDRRTYEAAKSQASASLQTVIQTTNEALLEAYHYYTSQIYYWTQTNSIKKLALELTKDGSPQKLIEDNFVKAKNVLIPIQESLALEGFFIIDLNGKNLASSRTSNIGTQNLVFEKDKATWNEVLSGRVSISEFLPSDVPLYDEDSPRAGNATLFILSPILDEMHRPQAVLSFRIHPKKILWNRAEKARVGKTGETYAINKKGFFVSHSRFHDYFHTIKHEVRHGHSHKEISDEILHDKAENENELILSAKNVLMETNGHNLQGYPDYRGEKVIGYWNWVNSLKLGLITEIDYDEAFSVYQSIRIIDYSICVLFIILSFLIIRYYDFKNNILRDKAREQALLNQSIFDNAQGIIFRSLYKNGIFPIITISNSSKMIFHESSEVMHNQSITQYLSEEDQKKYVSTIEKSIQEKKSYQIEYTVIRKDHSRKNVMETGTPVFIDGICKYIDGFILDITEKKVLIKDLKWQIESSKIQNSILQVSSTSLSLEEKIKLFLQSILDSNLAFIEYARIQYKNEKNEEVSIAFPESYFLLSNKEYKVSDLLDKSQNILGKLFFVEKNQALRTYRNHEFFEKIVTLISTQIENEITEHHLQVEKQKSIHNSKLAGLGEMASGIIHEVKNPLSTIQMASMSISKKYDDKEKVFSNIEKIKKSIDRILKIVDGLRKFSRKTQEFSFKEFSIHKTIQDSLSLIESKSKQHGVPISFLAEQDYMAYGDDIQVEQVLINLMSNAIDAVKDKETKWVNISCSKNKESQIEITVQDSGKGIPDEVVKNLFEPFFTTKEKGEGTGLGLSISTSIVKEHQGSLSYHLVDGHTAFTLTLPEHNK